MIRKLPLAGIAAVALLVATQRPADAQFGGSVVYCTNCSTIAQELLGYARQLEQLQQQIQTAQNTLNFYTNAVQNTASLPGSVYRDITGDITRIEGIAQQANLLSGQTGMMLGNLSAAGGYPVGNANTYAGQVAMESQAIANAMTQAANILNLQPNQLQNSSATLAALETQATSSGSRNAILQTLAGSTAATGQLVATQQGAVTAALQGILAYDTAQADREAYTVSLTTAQEQAGMQSVCAAAAATGIPAAPVCQEE
jgi:P-type conjugative transfer protein TrbJ